MSKDMTKMYIEVEKGKERMVREVLQALECVKVEQSEIINAQTLECVKVEQSEIINAKTIANNLAEYYGKYVRYKAPNGCDVRWQIIYANQRNIYLIADDYVSKEYVPCGRKGSNIYISTWILGKNDKYRLSMANVIKDYEGSVDIDEKLRFLNGKYFDALAGKSSNNSNIKAVAYMLDVNAWKGFAGHQADYAIGGPTLELLLQSQKLLNSHNKLHPIQVNTMGYDIKPYKFDVCDNVSYIADKSKAYGMWVASPSDYLGDYYVWNVSYYTYLDYESYNDFINGFRPLVFLKPDVTLKRVENEYEILN